MTPPCVSVFATLTSFYIITECATAVTLSCVLDQSPSGCEISVVDGSAACLTQPEVYPTTSGHPTTLLDRSELIVTDMTSPILRFHANKSSVLIPGGEPVQPPDYQPATITAPTFLIADVEPTLEGNQFSTINQESLGVVPEPSSAMFGAISLLLLWRRQTP